MNAIDASNQEGKNDACSLDNIFAFGVGCLSFKHHVEAYIAKNLYALQIFKEIQNLAVKMSGNGQNLIFVYYSNPNLILISVNSRMSFVIGGIASPS